MNKILKLFFVLLILSGCKKDKLVGDYNILEGNWRWAFSVKRTFNTIFFTEEYDTIYASQYPDTYEVEFLHKGKIYFKINNEIKAKYRVVFNQFTYEDQCGVLKSNSWRYVIYLNNKAKDPYGGCVNQDTLTAVKRHLPEDLTDYSAYPYEVSYTNYFLPK